jgi:tetratricopeptide (TPR) repeat protein
MRLAIVVAILLCVTAARAEDLAKAQAAYRSGMQHYDLTEYREALESFKEAYRSLEDPTFLFNIAQCYRQLGDKQQAIRFYRNYLIKVPNAPKRDQIHDMIAKLETEIAHEQAAKTGPPQGTLVPKEAPPPLAPAPSPSPEPVIAPPPPSAPKVTKPASTPVYKKWWLWTAVGAVAVVAVGVGLGVGLTRSPSTPTANTQFGTFHF